MRIATVAFLYVLVVASGNLNIYAAAVGDDKGSVDLIIQRLIKDQERAKTVIHESRATVFHPKWDKAIREALPEGSAGGSEDVTYEKSLRVALDGSKIRIDLKEKRWYASENRYMPFEEVFAHVEGVNRRYNKQGHSATIVPRKGSERWVCEGTAAPFICAYRLFDKTIGYAKPEEVQFSGQAQEDGKACLVIDKHKNGKVYRWFLAESCGYRPVRFQTFTHEGRLSWDIRLNYVPDERIGWRLASWKKTVLLTRSQTEAAVTASRINEEIPPDTFRFEFPLGTRVEDVIAGVEYTVGEPLEDVPLPTSLPASGDSIEKAVESVRDSIERPPMPPKEQQGQPRGSSWPYYLIAVCAVVAILGCAKLLLRARKASS